MSRTLMQAATDEPDFEEEIDSPEPSMFKAVDMLIKGMEVQLPQGSCFRDKDGNERTRARVRWWDNDATTYRAAALLEGNLIDQLPKGPIPPHVRACQPTDKPIFIGHYSLKGKPELLSERIGCVDYGAGHGGPLCAYRWDGEPTLDPSRFCSVQP